MYQSLTGADSELEAAAAELDYANQRFADLKAELTAQDQTLDRLKREQQSLELQLQTGSESLAEQEAELKQAEQHALETESELTQLAATLESAGEELLVLERHHREIEQQRSDDQLDLVKQGERLEGLKATVIRLDNELQQRIVQHEEADRRFATSTTKKSQIVLQILNTRGIRDEIILQAEQIQSAAMVLDREKMQLRTERSAIVEEELGLRKQRRERGDRQHTDEIRLRDMNHALVNLNERLEEEYQLKLADVVESGESSFALFREERSGNGPGGKRKNRDSHDSVAKSPTTADETDETDAPEQSPSDEAEGIQADQETAVVDDHEEPQDRGNLDLGELRFEDIRPEIEARVNRLRKQLKLMGAVNTDSLRDLEMLETRYTQLAAQLQDLVEARQTLEEIIRKINSESRRLFAETFETIRKNFQELFRQVFGGGEGDIILEDPNDVLDCGIDIAARPPGKELRSISLLSGGEKTMTAIALIMSIFKSKPSPFCILDEVDAALDEANVERFTAVVKAFQTTTQFIMITHHKRSMTVADVLYGVTMEESGISKRMSVRFEDVSDDGNFKQPPQTSAA
jgi:chromosome segregation protein